MRKGHPRMSTPRTQRYNASENVTVPVELVENDTSSPRVSRRSAISAGTLFLGAGLLGTTTPPAMATEPITLATVVNADDLAAECRDLFEKYTQSLGAHMTAWNRFVASLTPEQAKLARDASDTQTEYHLNEADWQATELARHLPGMAPSIRMIWEHITTVAYRQPGACCTPDAGYEP